jgi:hypothetical protein
MTKDEILDALEDEREKLLEAIDGLSEAQMAESGVAGDWSVKDILHHLSLWEAELVRLLWQAGQGEKPTTVHFSQQSVDQTNAAWYAQGKDRLLERVLDDLAAVRKQTIRRVNALPDEVFEKPHPYPWVKDQAFWEWIANDSFGHEAEHAEQIKQWRAQKRY